MKKYLKFFLLLVAVAGAFGYYTYHKPHQNMNNATTQIKLSATQLFSDYQVDETTANEKYLDKVMEISGKIKEVSTDEKGMTTLTLESGDDMFGIICQMDNLTKHNQTNFTEGEKINLKGICTGVLMDVVLVRCVKV